MQPAIKPSIPPGTTIGRYAVLRKLGRGGMGSVYEARHVDLGRRVAIKTLSRALTDNGNFVERFLREGRIAAQLEHPNVVGVTDFGTHDGMPYLVMEYLEGRDLGDLLKERGRLGVAETMDVVLPIAAALQIVHETGLVHRDLKPANVFLCAGQYGAMQPKLLDFGIAKPSGPDGLGLTKSAELLGTPLYMAPEQVRDARSIDSRADLYALGIIVYECVTGEVPFVVGESSLFEVLARIVGGEARAARAVAPDVPEALERVLAKAIAVEPKRRYGSAGELGAALLPFASETAQRAFDGVFSPASTQFDTTLPARAVPSPAPPSSPVAVSLARPGPPGKGQPPPPVASTARLAWRLGLPAMAVAVLVSGALVLVSVGFGRSKTPSDLASAPSRASSTRAIAAAPAALPLVVTVDSAATPPQAPPPSAGPPPFPAVARQTVHVTAPSKGPPTATHLPSHAPAPNASPSAAPTGYVVE